MAWQGKSRVVKRKNAEHRPRVWNDLEDNLQYLTTLRSYRLPSQADFLSADIGNHAKVCQFINRGKNWRKPGNGQERQAESMRINNLQQPHSVSSTAPQPFTHSNFEPFFVIIGKNVTRPYAKALVMNSKWVNDWIYRNPNDDQWYSRQQVSAFLAPPISHFFDGEVS